MTDKEILDHIISNGHKKFSEDCSFQILNKPSNDVALSVNLISQNISDVRYRTCMSQTMFSIHTITFFKSHNEWQLKITHIGVEHTTTYNFTRKTHDFYLACCINIDCEYLRLLYNLLEIFPAYTANLLTRLMAPIQGRMIHRVFLNLENNGLYYCERFQKEQMKSFVLSYQKQDISVTSINNNIFKLKNSWIDFRISQRLSKTAKFSFYFNMEISFFFSVVKGNEHEESAMYTLNAKSIYQGKFVNVEYHSKWLDTENCLTQETKQQFEDKCRNMISLENI